MGLWLWDKRRLVVAMQQQRHGHAHAQGMCKREAELKLAALCSVQREAVKLPEG
jgi:hypothetical protein